jgi:hypothetical protein
VVAGVAGAAARRAVAGRRAGSGSGVVGVPGGMVATRQQLAGNRRRLRLHRWLVVSARQAGAACRALTAMMTTSPPNEGMMHADLHAIL